MKILIYLLSLILCFLGKKCDIVVLGGTLASLGAIIHAPNNYEVCLVEPTERLGGQLG